jgi:hypothetical protein
MGEGEAANFAQVEDWLMVGLKPNQSFCKW